jgi:hypothetical protein
LRCALEAVWQGRAAAAAAGRGQQFEGTEKTNECTEALHGGSCLRGVVKN